MGPGPGSTYEDDEQPTGRLLTAPERAVMREILFGLPEADRGAAVRMLSRWLALQPADRERLLAVALAMLNPPARIGGIMRLLNLKSLLSALSGAAVVLLPELAKLPQPYGPLAGALLGLLLLHVKAPASKAAP